MAKKNAKKSYADKIHDWWLKQNRMIRKLQREGYKGLELIPEPKYYESRKRNYESFRKKYSTKSIKEKAYMPMINGEGQIELKNWYETSKIERRQRKERVDESMRPGSSEIIYEPLYETLYDNYIARIQYYSFHPKMAWLLNIIENDPDIKDAIIRDLQGSSPFAAALGGAMLPDISFRGSYEDADMWAEGIDAFFAANLEHYAPDLDAGYGWDEEME